MFAQVGKRLPEKFPLKGSRTLIRTSDPFYRATHPITGVVTMTQSLASLTSLKSRADTLRM